MEPRTDPRLPTADPKMEIKDRGWLALVIILVIVAFGALVMLFVLGRLLQLTH